MLFIMTGFTTHRMSRFRVRIKFKIKRDNLSIKKLPHKFWVRVAGQAIGVPTGILGKYQTWLSDSERQSNEEEHKACNNYYRSNIR